MSYTKDLKNQLGSLAIQLNAITDKAKSEGNRGLTSAEREQFHKLEADYTAFEDSIRIAEKSDLLSQPVANNIAPTSAEEMQDIFRKRKVSKPANKYEAAFQNYMRHGERTSSEDRMILNTMSTTTGSQGGYTVPVGFADKIDIAAKWFGGIEGTVTKLTTASGNNLQYPTINDTSNKGRFLAQNTQVTQTDLVFGQLTFSAYIASSDIVLIPLALIQDSYFDIEALAASRLGDRLGRLKNNACTVGTGSSQPTGIVTAAVTAGNLVTAGGASNSGEVTSITYNDLVNLEHAVDPAYRFNPSTFWMFSDTMLKTIKKLVDGNSRPLWQPGLTSSLQGGAGVDSLKPMILEHPYIINNDIAVPAASAYSALFGDMSKFVVREVEGGTELLVLRERYADYLQVGMTAFQRYDSNLVDAGTHPVAVFQQAAS